jgi:hypothetical protein
MDPCAEVNVNGNGVANALKNAVGTPEDHYMEEIFSNTIKFGKFALLALLLILSFINGHKEYISENPRKFMWDNFAVGGLGAIAISIIAAMRGRSDLIPSLAFVSFLLFFVYNVFRELSGFNVVTDPTKQTQGEAKQAKALKWPFLALVILSLIILPLMAFKAKVAHPLGFGWLALEALILAGLTALGEILVAKNHGEHGSAVAITGAGNFVLFFFFHIILQYGGFYNHVFSTGEAVA